MNDLAARFAAGGLAIEASAGSGKTFTLVEAAAARIRKRHGDCADGRCNVEPASRGLLLLTFTHLAAGQMAARLRRRLQGALAGITTSDAQLDLARLQRACLIAERDALEEHVPTTFHAESLSLLARNAAAVGSEPPPLPLPEDHESVTDELLRLWITDTSDAAAQRLRSAMTEAPVLLNLPLVLAWGGALLTLARNGGGQACAEWRAAFLRGLDARAPGATLEALRADLERTSALFAQAQAETRKDGALKIAKTDKLANHVRRIHRSLASNPDSFSAACSALNLVSGLMKIGDVSKWPSLWPDERLNGGRKAAAKALHGAWAAALDGHVLAPLRGPLSRALEALVDFAQQSIQPGSLRERAGLVTFDDCQALARDRLRSGPGGSCRPPRLEALWVDEFQDTDPVQAEMLHSLAGTLQHVSVVGDPKQSLYNFRGADLEQYRRVVADLEPAALHRSWRSSPQLCAFINAVFGKLLAPEGYTPMASAREGRADPRVFLHRLDDGANASDARERAARAIGARLQHWHGTGVPWTGMAALFPTRTSIPHLVQALVEAAVPFRLVAARDFVQDALWLALLDTLDCAVHKGHDHRLNLAALRNPLLGLESASYLAAAVSETTRPRDLLERCLGAHDPDHPGRRGLHLLLHGAGRIPLSSLATALLMECGWESFAREAFPASWADRLAEADLLIAALRAEEEGGRGPRQSLAALRARPAGSTRAPAAAGRDAVSLMTIHGAKGLEFDCVAVMGLPRHMHHNQTHRAVLEGAPDEHGLRAPRLRISIPPGLAGGEELKLDLGGFEAAREDRRLRDEAEQRRHLYVAFTRAREDLYVPLCLGPHTRPVPADAELLEFASHEGASAGWAGSSAPPPLPAGRDNARRIQPPPCAAGLSKASGARHLRISVTRLIEEALPFEPHEKSGALEREQALAWGRAVHGALQWLGPALHEVRPGDLQDALLRLTRATVPGGAGDGIRKLCAGWPRVAGALTGSAENIRQEWPLLCEYPDLAAFFAGQPELAQLRPAAKELRENPMPAWTALLREPKRPVLLEGIVDWCDLTAGNARIADFKTGSVSPTDRRYTTQLAAYRRMLTVFGYTVTNTYLLSLDSGTVYAM